MAAFAALVATLLAAGPARSLVAAPGAATYVGGLLGVHAQVELHEAERYARLQLHGLPVGGCLEGSAWFGAGERVALEPQLESALRRRFVSVVSAERHADDRLRVHVLLPVFGKRSIELRRVDR